MRLQTKVFGRTFSISARLTMLYTLVTLAVIMSLATILYLKISDRFDSNHLRFLQAKIAEQQTDLRDGQGRPEVLLDEISKETGESHPRQYLARLLSADGHVLGETPGLQGRLPVSAFPPAASEPLTMKNVRRVEINDDGDPDVFALVTVRMNPVANSPPLRMQLAAGITGDDKLLSYFRRLMWLALALLTPILILAGRWIATRGLTPLMRIVSAAKEVTPDRLSARIPTTAPWPHELGELVQVFNDMLTRLEEAFNRLSRFSSDLAHELRTPLSNMSGELEVCLMAERSGLDYRVVLESNLEECRRLSVLVENLLFVARAEHAGLGLRRETFDAGEACTWVLDQLTPGATANGIRLLVDGHATLKADPILFRQALVNLLANALRYSHAGGQVLVGLQSDKDGSTTVRVSDHGMGIDAEHLPKLFDRFYQVSSSRTRNAGQGTGLGLSIVKAIVDMHGGSVHLDSAPGVGTTVTMHFPQ
ncbi:MAG: heavy metal sensor histidine kinase [Rhodanobacter sp.]